jgi:hypothetical protein
MEDLNIRHFKLTSGEELISLVQYSDENAFVLERPVQVKLNSLGMYMYSPWFPFSDKKIFKLFKRHIVNHVEIEEDSKKHYINYSVNGVKEETPSFNEIVEKVLKDQQLQFDDDPLLDYEQDEPESEPKKTIH